MDDTQDLSIRAFMLVMTWLEPRELASLSATRKEFLQPSRESHVWLPFLNKLEQIPLHDFVDRTTWTNPDFPDDNQWDIKRMLIPPRPHGDDVGHDEVLPHPDDKAAQLVGGPLYLSVNEESPNLPRFNRVGRLEDMFFRWADAQGNFIDLATYRGSWCQSVPVWIEREFPVQCSACAGMALANEKELIDHCVSYSHISKAQNKWDRVPLEFVDPRHGATYATLDTRNKVRVLGAYKRKFLNFLRRIPTDEATSRRRASRMDWLLDGVLFNLQRLRDDSINSNNYTPEEYDAAMSNCTLERVTTVCIEDVVVRDFLSHGLCGVHCLQVARQHWGGLFNGLLRIDLRRVCSGASGLEFPDGWYYERLSSWGEF